MLTDHRRDVLAYSVRQTLGETKRFSTPLPSFVRIFWRITLCRRSLCRKPVARATRTMNSAPPLVGDHLLDTSSNIRWARTPQVFGSCIPRNGSSRCLFLLLLLLGSDALEGCPLSMFISCCPHKSQLNFSLFLSPSPHWYFEMIVDLIALPEQPGLGSTQGSLHFIRYGIVQQQYRGYTTAELGWVGWFWSGKKCTTLEYFLFSALGLPTTLTPAHALFLACSLSSGENAG